MKFEDCVNFANENPVCWLATVDGDKPRVRAMGMWIANENGFYFSTNTAKELYKQFKENPNIEIGFHKPGDIEAGDMLGTMLRVSGEVEILDDPELMKKLVEERPFLKEIPNLFIFRIPNGEAHFWNMGSAFEPKKFIKFGN